MPLSCGTNTTGSDQDNKDNEGGVLGLLLSQDNFDREDFGLDPKPGTPAPVPEEGEGSGTELPPIEQQGNPDISDEIEDLPEEIVYGCMDPAAINYNPDATIDYITDNYPNGICVYPSTPGCMDTTANNYNSNATEDDGSCTYDVVTPPPVVVTPPVIIVPPPTNVIPGCTDVNATNYNPNATVNDPQNPCTYPIVVSGCTDPTATNFDPTATQDDGSCTQPIVVPPPVVEIYGCMDPVMDNYDCANGNKPPQGSLTCGDGVTIDDGSCIRTGCRDQSAENYDPLATHDYTHKKCIYTDTDNDGVADKDEISGCTNPLSSNYNSLATDDDGSCTPPTLPPTSTTTTGKQVHVGTAVSTLNPTGGYKHTVKSNSDYAKYSKDYLKKYSGTGGNKKGNMNPKGYHDNSICPILFKCRNSGNKDSLDNVFDPYSAEELIAKMTKDGVNASNLPKVENVCCHLPVYWWTDTYQSVEGAAKNSRHYYNIQVGNYGECQYNVDIMGGNNSGNGDTGITKYGTDGWSYGIGSNGSTNGYAVERINGLFCPDRRFGEDKDKSDNPPGSDRGGYLITINLTWVGNVLDKSDGIQRKDLAEKTPHGTKRLKYITMSPPQAYAYLKLIKYFTEAFPNIKIIGHNQATLGEFKAGKKRGGKTCPGWWQPELNDLMGLADKHSYNFGLNDLSKKDRENLQSWKVGSSNDTLSNHSYYQNKSYKNTAHYVFALAQAGATDPTRAGYEETLEEKIKRWKTMECAEFSTFYKTSLPNLLARLAFLKSLSNEDQEVFKTKVTDCGA